MMLVSRRINKNSELFSQQKYAPPFISNKNRIKRLKWCKERLTWMKEEQRQILWSDQSPFVLRYNRASRVWKAKSELSFVLFVYTYSYYYMQQLIRSVVDTCSSRYLYQMIRTVVDTCSNRHLQQKIRTECSQFYCSKLDSTHSLSRRSYSWRVIVCSLEMLHCTRRHLTQHAIDIIVVFQNFLD